MPQYKQISAGSGSTVHNGSVHGGQTNNYTIVHCDDNAKDEAIVPAIESVRSIDARFDGDERALAVWLKRNNLPVSKNKRAGMVALCFVADVLC